jgi:hypothetical protein
MKIASVGQKASGHRDIGLPSARAFGEHILGVIGRGVGSRGNACSTIGIDGTGNRRAEERRCAMLRPRP